VLQIEGLSVSYGSQKILKDVSFCLDRGESLAIIGESGAGKTTLGKCILGLADGDVFGEVRFNGDDILDMSQDELREIRGRDIAMVFQNAEDALHPLYTVSDQVIEAIRVHGPDGDEVSRRAYGLLEAVGLDRDKADSYPHQLSGGQKQRALIAMALANDPEVLILDEPTASLDAMTKADIIQLLRSAASGKISIVVTHDISLAAKLTSMTAVLYAGRILETGRTSDIISGPRHPYTRGLLRSYPNMTTTKDLQGIPGRMEQGVEGCPFHERCTQKVDRCASDVPALVESGGRMIACHRGGVVPLLKVRGLCKSFEGHRVLDCIDLTLFEGETVAVVGESGSGKTTLSRAIMGLEVPDCGEIEIDCSPVNARDKKFYEKVQMVFQNPRDSISHRMNILQAVREPLDVHKKGSEDDKLRSVRRALDDVELSYDEKFLARYPHTLSGGEVQRVAIARALVLGPKILIADEPTSALDASVQAKVLRLLLDIQEKRGLSMLFITHDIALARKISDQMVVMQSGRIVEIGPTSDILTRPQHPYTKRLIECSPDLSALDEDEDRGDHGSAKESLMAEKIKH